MSGGLNLPFIGLEEVEAHTGRIISIQDTSALKSAVSLFAAGDVLYGRLRPYLNKVVTADFAGAASAEFIVFPRSEILEPRYLRRVMMSPEFVSFTAVKSTGDRPRVSYESISAYAFLVPPIGEQRRIVGKIDSLSAKSGRARGHLDHVPRLVEKYKQAILAAAFRGDLTREWRTFVGRQQSWESTTIGRVLTDIRYGTAKKCTYSGGAVGVLRIPNVQQGRVTLDDIKSADFNDGDMEAFRLREGDILVIRSNGSLDLVGRTAIVPDAAVGMLFAGYLIRLRLDTELADPQFAQLYLQAADVRARLERFAKSTSGVNNINSIQLKSLPLMRPDVDEQHEIIRRVHVAFAWIDRLASEATSARRLIDRLDQAVLAKAFRGELVPQDPNDEPAGVLLERIRAERVAEPATRGPKRAVEQPSHGD